MSDPDAAGVEVRAPAGVSAETRPVETAADPALLPTDQLESAICELAGQIAAATCRWLLLVAELDRRQAHLAWGCRSAADWLSLRCGIGRGTAREQVRVAKALADMPEVRAAFAAGRISYCKVRAITRVATAATEEGLVGLAEHATGAQLERIVAAHRGARQAADPGEAQRRHRSRALSHWIDADGSVCAFVRLEPEEGARFVSMLERCRNAGDDATIDEGMAPPRTEGAARADALIGMVDAAEAWFHVPGPGVDEAPATAPAPAPAAALVVHVDVDGAGRIDGGANVSAETLRRLGCDASVQTLAERDGLPLALGRRRRTVSPRLWRAVLARDGGCRFPGCHRRTGLHAHHVVHWADGGSTDPGNMVALCRYHHRSVHEEGFTVRAAGPGTFRFAAPDGRVIPDAVAPGSGWPADRALRLANRRCGVRVDATTTVPRSGGERFDLGLTIDALLSMERDGASISRS